MDEQLQNISQKDWEGKTSAFGNDIPMPMIGINSLISETKHDWKNNQLLIVALEIVRCDGFFNAWSISSTRESTHSWQLIPLVRTPYSLEQGHLSQSQYVPSLKSSLRVYNRRACYYLLKALSLLIGIRTSASSNCAKSQRHHTLWSILRVNVKTFQIVSTN